MKKLLLLIPFLALTLLIADYRTDKIGDTGLGVVSDTADVVRGEIADTSAVYAGDSANAARSDAGDTAAVYASDTADIVRAEIDDSITVYADTMEASPVLMNELQVIDSFYIPIWSDVAAPATASVGMFGADTTNDSLFFYLPAGKTCIYPQASAGAMTAAAIAGSLNTVTQSMTQTWEWDGGDIIAADGQSFIGTDGTEADSFTIQDNGDTTFFTSDNIIVIGDAGATVIGDTLVIPKWDDKNATATLGAMALDTTGTDTCWVYTEDGWKSFVPAAAGAATTNYYATNIQLLYAGGGYVNSSNEHSYRTTATNDYINSYSFSLPFVEEGDTVLIDTITIRISTQGTEDSVKVVFQKTQDGAASTVDSIPGNYGGGATGWAVTANVLNADYQVEQGYTYRFYMPCVNNGANDILFDMGCHVVWHKKE